MDFCDFLAEDELIEIVPNFKHNHVLNLINGDFGPFIPAIPVRVPMWMAISLFRQQKCKINLPSWIQELDVITDEQKNSDALIKMPCEHWCGVIKLLEHNNIPLPVTHLALFEIRQNILKKSVASLLDTVVAVDDDKISRVKIKNITKFELSTLKKLILINLAISKGIQKP